MEHYSFDQLPEAVGKLEDKLDNIERLLKERHQEQPQPDKLLTIEGASRLLNLSIHTIYGKVSKREIPVNKRGKRLYFLRSELEAWVRSGRKKTAIELRKEAEKITSSRKKEYRHSKSHLL